MKRLFFVLAAAVVWASPAGGSDIRDTLVRTGPSRNYVRLNLPKGVSVELPRNWVAVSGNTRQTLDAAVEAMTSTVDQPQSELPFAANLYDDGGKAIAIFNIRYYPAMDISQDDVRESTRADIDAFDEELHASMDQSMSGAGMRVLTWLGTRRIAAGSKTVLLSEYRRAGLKGSSPFHVTLFRVLDTSKSFTITYSYDEALAILLKPIGDRVISSVQSSP